MSALQARLLAGRAVQAAQAQERFARRLRPADGIPAQRSADEDESVTLILAAGATN